MFIAHAAALFEVPISTYDASGTPVVVGLTEQATGLLTDTLAEPGVLAFLVLIMALPLVFWVAKKVINVFRLEDARDKELYDRSDAAIAESKRLQREGRIWYD